ncbi:MAG: inositol monophosphatase [Candidatus Aenigmarchaeota archaeon]|nr:inositol monophosphatase [Candidatus Aenigmarchaeota archaeon]
MEETNVAIKAARMAGDYLLKQFKKSHQIDKKGKHDFVTEADKEAEKIIIKYLKKKYPEYSLLSEEAGEEKGDEHKWVVDPLDGTANYMLGVPFFNTSLGLVLRDKILLSVIYSPITDELFVAELYRGSKLNEKKIQISERHQIEGSIMSFCHNNTSREIKRNVKIYQKLKQYPAIFNQPRAGNLEMAYLADGRIDAFINNGAKTWDSVCGALLVREAGGKVTDFNGKDWTIYSKDLLASNGIFHDKLLKLLKGV